MRQTKVDLVGGVMKERSMQTQAELWINQSSWFKVKMAFTFPNSFHVLPNCFVSLEILTPVASRLQKPNYISSQSE
jgi:hypothetical protein